MSRKTRQPGRPALLDEEVREKLIEATKLGSPMSVAASYVGISQRTFERWMQRGYEAQTLMDDEQPVPEEEEPFRVLFREVERARSQAAVMHVGLIQRAAKGGVVTEETTKKYRDPETGQVVEETTLKRTAPDWRAGAWYLERQHRHHFGKDKELQVEITGGAGAGSTELGNVDAVAERIRGNIADLAAAVAEAKQITDGRDEELVIEDADVVE